MVHSMLLWSPLKKYFELVDSAGHWFSCCAIGEHGGSPILSHGAEIIAFFATGRSTVRDPPAYLYLFQDAVIVQVGIGGGVPNKRYKLEIS